MTKNGAKNAGEGGFTLLEVMVAFVIAALALGVLYRGTVDGLLQARIAANYQEAISRARSRLAAVGHGSDIAAGDQSGDDGGGFRWRTLISVKQASPRPSGQIQPGTLLPVLYAVRVAIGWGDGSAARQVELDSERLGFAPPAPP